MKMMRNLVVSSTGVVGMLLWPSAAFAHPMQGVGDFYAGMLHPVVTLESILPIIALSLLAGQQARQTAIHLLCIFPAALVFGALLALFRPILSQVGIIQLGLTALFGILVALSRPLPVWFPIGLGGVLGITVGWTTASEITAEVSPYRFIAGLSVGGLLLIAYGIGVVRHLKTPWTQIAIRVVGSWIAAVGILVSGLR